MEKKPALRQWAGCLLVGLLASLLAWAAAPLAEGAEYLLLDWHLRNTQAPENDQKVVLILGGDRSMIELGNWPWPRETHAAMLEERLAGARAVAYDVFLVDQTAPEQDAALAQAIANQGHVVLGSAFRQDGVLLQPLESFRANATTGYFNYYPDDDFVMRRYPLAKVAEYDGFSSFTPSFLYSVLAEAGQQPSIDESGVLHLAESGKAIPLEGGRSVFKLAVHGDAYSAYEFSDVLQGKIPAEAFQDAVVFVGISATAAADNIHTPEGYLPGTRVLADLYYTISSGYMPVQPHAAVQVLAFALLLGLCMGAAMALPNRTGWLPLVLALAGMVLATHLLFLYGGVYFPVAAPAIALVLCGALQLIYLRVMRENQQKQQMLLNMITCLVSAVDAKDPITAGHSQRVSEISVLIARKKGLARKQLEDIRFAGLIHDIGKIGVPDTVLNKPGRFTPEEFEQMKAHPHKGMVIMEHAGLPASVMSGILDHHERQDGKGYPNGKTGEELHLFAEIIKIADVYDALVSKRQYKDPWPLEKVCDVLYEGRGTEFNTGLIDLFLREIAPPQWAPPAKA